MPTDLPQPNSPNPERPNYTFRRPLAPARRDSGAYRVATVAGIPIRLHWTFFGLLLWFSVVSLRPEGRNEGGLPMEPLLFVLALFLCVVLHELGHALTALRYGIRTREIVLYPLGGIASLESPPPARQELWIALAGPAVNLVIAGLLYAILTVTGQPIPPFRMGGPPTTFLADLFWTNIALLVFNMLPAFPMDGGRVLRSLLAHFTNEIMATGIAARIGQFLAVGMGLIGVFGIPGVTSPSVMLIVLAVFIYFAAGQEAAAIQTRVLTEGHRVREAMLREFHTLTVGNTLREAADRLLAGSQQDFPVMHGGEVVGVLSRAALVRGMASEGPDGYLAGVMDRDFVSIHPDAALDVLLSQAQLLQNSPVLVMEGEEPDSQQLVGMVTQENLLEFLMLSQVQPHH